MRSRAVVRLAWAASAISVLAVLAWSRRGDPALLAAAASTFVFAAVAAFAIRRREGGSSVLLQAALFMNVVLLLTGGVFNWHFHNIATQWDNLASEREAQVRQVLDRRVSTLIEQGRRTAALAASLQTRDTVRLFREVEALRTRSNVDAIALFGEASQLVAWAGEHRGRVPDSVRVAAWPVQFIERPLYSYIYFAEPVQDGTGVAVAAVLLDVSLPQETVNEGFAQEFESLAARQTTFIAGPGSPGDYSIVVGRDTLAHARIEPLSQAEWRRDALQLAQRLAIALIVPAFVLLTLAWLRAPLRPSRAAALVPALVIIAAAGLAPLGPALGLDRLFSPGLFVLPGPGDISLGTLFFALLLWAIFVSTALEAPKIRTAPRLFVALAGLAVAVLYPLTIRLLVGTGSPDEFRAATAPLLEQGGPLWIVLQLTGTLLLACLTALLLPVSGRLVSARYRRDVTGVMVLSIAAAIITAASLSLFVLWLASSRARVPPILAALWILPFGFSWFGYNLVRGSGRRLVRWLLAGMLGATALMPQLWSAQISARLEAAERDLSTLGVRSDPYLEYLLREFARESRERNDRGEDRQQLLYRSWVSSGLAREAYPARATIWTADDLPQVDLSLGESLSRPIERTVVARVRDPARPVPAYLREAFVNVRETGSPRVLSAVAAEDVNHAVVVPLQNGRLVTIEVPPRRSFDRATVLAPLLGTAPDATTQLELVPVRSLEVEEGIWAPMPNGWRSEALVHYPDGTYHAHVGVTFPPLGVRVARGVLLIAGDLLVLVLVWLLGRGARGEPVRPAGGWSLLPRTWRGRVTAALFAFFLLPTVTFGYVAYRALAREVTRAAQIVAERAVQQGVIEFQDPIVNGNLIELASHSGTEMLRYFQGELTSLSSEEALELGLYDAWMPPDVHLTLKYSDDETEVRTRRLGQQEFLTAFRNLEPNNTGALAVPVSLQSAQTSERQLEMAHMILFAALVGGLLSLALSVAVGRALTGPIGQLQRAAAAVGSGKLRVKLPENTGGEFGKLNESFNRMVRQLRRARAREARTARVLAWGEMARQVAHEIKNPLTPIKLSVQHLRRAFGDRRPDFERILNDNVEQILVEIDRLSEISRAFSRYGAPLESAGPLVAVDVAAVVQESMTLYQTGDAELNYVERVERGLPPALARPDELKEVILNLLENARNATEPGDTIQVTARISDDQIEVCVEDNGSGIPEEMLPHIFEPHFSTRSAGTGLGLAIVRRLVESWGGKVTAESEAGRGTVVRVRLAIASEAVNYRGAR